jgi:hypothetical protein
MASKTRDADRPLHGQAPAADQFRDRDPEGENPNDSWHLEAKPEFRQRPEKYPAAKQGLAGTDVPKKR